MDIDFPHKLKLKHKIENVHPGVIIKGSDNEPIITVYGRGVYLQYRLISFDRVEETWKSNLTDDEERKIEDIIENNLSRLFAELKIRHYVKFTDDSPCYYDFDANQIYGAYGVRDKKGPIKGEPFKPSPSSKYFIDTLTQVPKANVNILDDIEYQEYQEKKIFGEGSLSTLWGYFTKLDSSIGSTFVKVSKGTYSYKGNEPIYQVGEEIGGTDTTLSKVFSCIAYRNIVATFDTENRRLNISLLGDVEAEDVLAFLGLDSDMLDSSSVNIERLVKDNYFDSTDGFEFLLDRYTNILEGVWSRLIRNIETNLLYTFRASSCYEETLNVPERESDLIPYPLVVHTVRWNNALKQACSYVKNIIQSTRAGVDFFMCCTAEVDADSVIGYVAALVLVSFSYCKTLTKNYRIMVARARYKNKLVDFIREKFKYSPPSGSDSGAIGFDELQTILQDLLAFQNRMLSEERYEDASEIGEIIDKLKLKNYDENSLLPPSNGRDH